MKKSYLLRLVPLCIQRGSKNSYDHIELGSSTQLGGLYVDIPIFGSRFANQVVEGGVRPPNLARAGFITGTGSLSASTSSTISIQWDTGLYQCNVQPNAIDTPFECIVSNPVHCPAMTDFWMSVYNPSSGGDILHVKAIWFEDETTAKYTFSEEFIRESGSAQTDCASSCSEILIGGSIMQFTFEKLVPFFVPDCVFDYPDMSTAGIVIDVGAGSVLSETPQPNEFGWDVDEYGGPIDAVCPQTPEPTRDPTADPTTDPTNAPSFAPTPAPSNAPSSVPSMAPTTPPTAAPSNAPSFAPSVAPSASPLIGPTRAPSFTPSNAPSRAPSIPPSVAPTKPPSSAPTSVPSHAPSSNPTLEPTTASPTFDVPISITFPIAHTNEPMPNDTGDTADAESNSLDEWIASYWIYLPMIILVLGFTIWVVVFGIMDKKRKLTLHQPPQIQLHQVMANEVSSQWKCGKCTFLNASNASHCVICSNPTQQGTSMGEDPAVQQQLKIMKGVGQLMLSTNEKPPDAPSSAEVDLVNIGTLMDVYDREKEQGFLFNLRSYVEVNAVIDNDVVKDMDTKKRPAAKKMVSLQMEHRRAESSISCSGTFNVRNIMKGSVSIASQPNIVAMEDSDSDKEGLFEEADIGTVGALRLVNNDRKKQSEQTADDEMLYEMDEDIDGYD